MTKDTIFKVGMRVIPVGSHDNNGKEGVITERFDEQGMTGESRAWCVDFGDGNISSAHYERHLKLAFTSWKERYTK